MKDFNTFMGSSLGARKTWLDWYPMQENLIAGLSTEDDAILLVDIRGGWGHDLIAFHAKYRNKGQLMLQDLPDVIKDIRSLPSGIEVVEHGFFSEQPIKGAREQNMSFLQTRATNNCAGARAYFYHRIMHDWSDYKCVKILRNVKEAVKPGYSKLYIHEIMVPDTKASTYVAMLDMTMICFSAGMERTARQWKELLKKVGLTVLKVWPHPEEGASGIVAAVVTE
jgi:hypothetical protein